MQSTNTSKPLSSDQKIVEFDMYGIIGIRLNNPSNRDVTKIENQFGLTQKALQKTPDISIQFIDTFSEDRLNYLGLNSAAYSKDQFYLLDRKDGSIQAQIPFQSIGDHCTITCRSGLSTIPFLPEIIMFSLMKKNFIWLHASAFSFNGNSILVMGWEKGGKTESLLAFGNQNAHYIGDEMVALSSDGQKMFGIPIAMAIWEWQIKYLPKILPTIKVQQAILFKVILSIEKFYGIFAEGQLKKIFPLKIIGDVLPALKRKLKIWAHPNELFKNQQGKQGQAPDKVFLVMSHNQPDISINLCDPEEIAQRMAISNQYERMYFFKYYRAFKFAFPHLKNDFLETIDETQNTLLSQALKGKESYKVIHPYPVSLDDLFNKMKPFCQNKSQTAGLKEY